MILQWTDGLPTPRPGMLYFIQDFRDDIAHNEEFLSYTYILHCYKTGEIVGLFDENGDECFDSIEWDFPEVYRYAEFEIGGLKA